MRLIKKDLAAKLGVSERALTTWQREGLPVLQHGKRGQPNAYDLAAVVRWLDSTGRGQRPRMGDRPIDIEKLKRELALDQPVPVAPAPPEFPDPGTVAAVAEAACASLVQAAALMVEVLGLDPVTAIRCVEIAHGEQASAFEDVHGFRVGNLLFSVSGDARLLLEDDGLEQVAGKVARLVPDLDPGTVDIWVQTFEQDVLEGKHEDNYGA